MSKNRLLLRNQNIVEGGNTIFNNTTAYYKLDGTTAGVAIDEVNGNNGFITSNIIQGVTGKINTAFKSNSTNTDYLRIPKVVFDENNFYHSAWFYYDSVAGQKFYMICRDNLGGILLDITDQISFVYLGVVGSPLVNSGAIDNAWNHVIVEKNGGNVKIYINNVLKFDQTENYVVANADLYYGVVTESNGTIRSGSSNPFLIDELDFRNTPYTQEQRDYLYNAGAGNTYVEPPLQPFVNSDTYYKLDGTTAGVAIDEVNGNDGFITAGITQGVTGKINTAFKSDGVGTEYLRIPKETFDENNFYHSGWFYYDSVVAENFNMVCRGDGGFTVVIDSQIQVVWFNVVGATPVNSDAIDNAWNHVIVEKTGGNIKVYINNVLKFDQTETYIVSNANLYYGVAINVDGTVNTTASYPFILDELDFRNTPYTQKERDYLYNAGAGTTYVAPITTTPTYINTAFPYGKTQAYYKLDETTGDVIDSANDYNGTIIGGITQGVVGKINNAADFDGSTGYIDFGNNDLATFSDGVNDTPFTMRFWVNYGYNGIPFINKWGGTSDTNHFKFKWVASISRHQFLVSDGAGGGIPINFTRTVNPLSWHHFVLTYDGSKSSNGFNLYINGASVGQTTSAFTFPGFPNTITPTYFGFDGVDYFDGKADEIAIIKNKVWTPSEVTDDYNNGDGRTFPTIFPAITPTSVTVPTFTNTNTEAYFKLDETIGTVTDSTNNNYLGTPVGGVTQGAIAKINTGLRFDGVNDYIDFGRNNLSNFTDGAGNNIPFTIRLWLNFDVVTGDRMLFSKWTINQKDILWGWSDSLGFYVYIEDSGISRITQFPFTPTAGQWYHLVLTHDASATTGGFRLYVDATEISKTTPSEAFDGFPNGTEPLNFGRRKDTNNRYFDGAADEITILRNEQWSLFQVTEDYNSGIGRTYVEGTLFSNTEGYFKLDETSGNFTDSVNNYVGTPVGGLTQGVAGKINNAADFDGVDDYIDFGNNDLSNFTDGSGNNIPFTIRLWVNFDDTSANQQLFNKWETGREDILWVYGAGFFGFSINVYDTEIRTIRFPFTPTAGQWYHITLTYDGSKSTSAFRLYIDGSEINKTSIVRTFNGFNNGTEPLNFGRRKFDNSEYFNGKADEIAIIKYEAWTPTKVTEDYNSGVGTTYIAP